MVAKVVDASAIAALLFGEPEAPRVVDRLDRATMAAPMLLDIELANVCVKKVRRSPAHRAELLAVYELRNRFGVERCLVDQDAVVRLALDTGLSAYDASYLWLSRQLGAELVTLDRQLAKVAGETTP